MFDRDWMSSFVKLCLENTTLKKCNEALVHNIAMLDLAVRDMAIEINELKAREEYLLCNRAYSITTRKPING
jgi:hypothetical protein